MVGIHWIILYRLQSVDRFPMILSFGKSGCRALQPPKQGCECEIGGSHYSWEDSHWIGRGRRGRGGRAEVEGSGRGRREKFMVYGKMSFTLINC
jgi:hypothetical protein